MKRNVFQKNKRKTFRIKGGGELETTLKILKESPYLTPGIKGTLEKKYPTLESLRAVENITDEEFQELVQLSGYQTQLKKCIDQLTLLRQTLQKEEAGSFKLKKVVAISIEEIIEQKNNLKSADKKSKQLQESLKIKTSALESLTALKAQDNQTFENLYAQLNEEKTRLLEELNDSEQNLQRAVQELGEEKVMREARQKTLTQLKARLAAAPKESDVLELREQITRLEQENSDKEQAIQKGEEEHALILESILDIQRASIAAVNEYERQLAEKNEELSDLKKQKKKELAEKTYDINYLKLHEIPELQRRVGELETEIGTYYPIEQKLRANLRKIEEIIGPGELPLIQRLKQKLDELAQLKSDKLSLGENIQRLQDSLAELRARNEQLERDNATLTAELATTQQELLVKQGELTTSLQKEQQTLKQYQEQLSVNFRLMGENAESKQEQEQLRLKLAQNVSQLARLEEEKRSSKLGQEATIKKLREDVTESKREYDSVKSNSDDKAETAGIRVSLFLRYKLSLINLISFLESYEQNAKSEKEILQQLVTENDELDRTFMDKLKDCDEAIAKLQQLEGVQQLLKSQHEETIGQLRVQLQEFQRRIPELENLNAKLVQLKEQNDLLLRGVSSLQTDAESLTRNSVTKEDLAQKTKEVNDQIVLLKQSHFANISTIQTQFATLTSNIGNLGTTIQQQSEALSKAVRQSLDEKDEKFDRFEEGVQGELEEMKELIGNLQEEKDKFFDMQQKFSIASLKADSLQGQLDKCLVETKELQRLSTEQGKKTAEAQGALKALNEAFNKLNTQREQHDRSLQEALDRSAYAEKRAKEKDDAVQAALVIKTQSETELKNAREELDRKQQALQNAQQSAGTTREEIGRLEAALENAKGEKQEAERLKEEATADSQIKAKDLEVQKALKEALEQERKERQTESERARKESEEATQILREAKDEAERQVAALLAQTAAEQQKAVELQTANLERFRAETKLEQEQALSLQETNYKLQLSNLKRQLDTAEALKDTFQQSQAGLEQQLQEIQAKLIEVNSEKDNLERYIDTNFSTVLKLDTIFSPVIKFQNLTPDASGKYILSVGIEVKFRVENAGTRSIVLFLYQDTTDAVHVYGNDVEFSYVPKDGLTNYIAFKIEI